MSEMTGVRKAGLKEKIGLLAAGIFIRLTMAAPAWGTEAGKLNYPDPAAVDSPGFGTLLLRMALALAVVVGLALLLGKLLPRLAPYRVQGRWIRVIGQSSLGQNKSLVLTEILGKIYVLAVTDHQITRLLDENELDPVLVRKIADEERDGRLINSFAEDKFRRLLTAKLTDLRQHFGRPGKMG